MGWFGQPGSTVKKKLGVDYKQLFRPVFQVKFFLASSKNWEVFFTGESQVFLGLKAREI